MSLWIILVIVFTFLHWKVIKQKRLRYESQKTKISKTTGYKLLTESTQVDEVASQIDKQPEVLEGKSQFYLRIISLKYSIAQLAKSRSDAEQYRDLKIMDGMRVLCLLWVLTLGVCQFTMSASS